MRQTMLEIYTPQTAQDFQAYFTCRWQLLRAPWDQPVGSEKDEFEDVASHLAAKIDNRIVGVGRIHKTGQNCAQIRYMAVENPYQHRGIGTAILERLEQQARDWQCSQIVLNARESATGFYRNHGYTTTRKTHMLFGCIQHWQMTKNILVCSD